MEDSFILKLSAATTKTATAAAEGRRTTTPAAAAMMTIILIFGNGHHGRSGRYKGISVCCQMDSVFFQIGSAVGVRFYIFAGSSHTQYGDPCYY